MGIETEVKIEVDKLELEAVREKLPSLGALCTLPRVEEKNELFDFPDGRLAKRERILRLRERGALSRVTFKIKEAEDIEFRVRKELESDVSNPDQVRSIFLALGLEAWFGYQKHREIWKLGSEGEAVKISLDETVFGLFIELEGEPRAIRRAASQLALDSGRFTTVTYIEIFKERSGRSAEDP